MAPGMSASEGTPVAYQDAHLEAYRIEMTRRRRLRRRNAAMMGARAADSIAFIPWTLLVAGIPIVVPSLAGHAPRVLLLLAISLAGAGLALNLVAIILLKYARA